MFIVVSTFWTCWASYPKKGAIATHILVLRKLSMTIRFKTKLMYRCFQIFLLPQVFSHANVYLSLGGRQFSLEPIQFTYMPDNIMEKARNVTVKLHHKQAKFLKLQMYFSNQWLLISEVYFQSGMYTYT